MPMSFTSAAVLPRSVQWRPEPKKHDAADFSLIKFRRFSSLLTWSALTLEFSVLLFAVMWRRISKIPQRLSQYLKRSKDMDQIHEPQVSGVQSDESHQKVTLEYCLDIARAASGGASFSS
jgi:hypothetical protein